jgi:hypothetical protein
VNTEHTPIDDGTQGQVVEHLTAPSPDAAPRPVLALTLVVEAVDLRYLPRLVVAADEVHAVGIAHFEGEKEEEGLDGVEAAVDKVAEEEVGGVGGGPAGGKQLEEVEELAVYVAAYLHALFAVSLTIENGEVRERTVTGESTCCTFASSMRISRALMQRRFTCSSEMISHLLSCSI